MEAMKIKSSFLFNGAIACSVLAILLPAHPGLQQFFKTHNIPSSMVSFLFAAGILYVWILRHRFDDRILMPVTAYFLFALIILIRSVASPALGLENFLKSLRGIFILSPLAILSALACRYNAKTASGTIFCMGFTALLLYVYIMLSGDLLEIVGFRSITSDTGEDNYQSTAFYIGLAAIGFLAMMDYPNRLVKVASFLGFIGVVVLMATVGARAAVGAVGLCFVLYYLSNLFGSFRKSIWLSLCIVMVILSSVALYLNNENIVETLSVIERFEVVMEDADGSNRAMLFTSAIKLWLESPLTFLFGAGLGAFPAYIGEHSPGWYPHNFLLETLSEGGIVAVLPMLALVFLTAKKFLSDARVYNVPVERRYLGYCAVYAVLVYSFIGGLSVLWIPFFFVFSYLSCENGNSYD